MSRERVRFRMTYPHAGSVIYKSMSVTKAAKRCYDEFKRLSDIGEGLFAITDIDNDKEYQFKVRGSKMYNMNKKNKKRKSRRKKNKQYGGKHSDKLIPLYNANQELPTLPTFPTFPSMPTMPTLRK